MTSNTAAKADPNELLKMRSELKTGVNLFVDAKTDVNSHVGKEIVADGGGLGAKW